MFYPSLRNLECLLTIIPMPKDWYRFNYSLATRKSARIKNRNNFFGDGP